MRLMLDTQVMLWWLLGDRRLRPETRELMATCACTVSVASVWEVAIKHRIGKLPIDPVTFRDQSTAAGAALLAINDAHAIETAGLPDVHDSSMARPLRIEFLIATGLRRLGKHSAWVGPRHAWHAVADG